MKLTKLYTKTGDKGQTSLVGGARVSKTDVRIEAYGTIDELNSHLGLLAAMAGDVKAAEILVIQRELFALGGFLATDQQQSVLYDSCKVKAESVTWLEERIDAIQQAAGPIDGFVIPGGTMASAQAHVCRTVCRRAERCIVALRECVADTESGWQEAMQYVNRLSDYLFALARVLV